MKIFFIHKLKTQHAFTLMEVLISLTIMIVLMSMALPAWNIFLKRTEEDILQKKILDAISLAKSEALIRHVPIALCKSQNLQTCGGEWQEGQLIFLDSYADGVVHQSQQILSVMQIQPHKGVLHWQAFPKYRQYLQFNSQTLHNDNGTFWHCHAQTIKWAIIINQGGRTRLAYPDKDGNIRGSHDKPLLC